MYSSYLWLLPCYDSLACFSCSSISFAGRGFFFFFSCASLFFKFDLLDFSSSAISSLSDMVSEEAEQGIWVSGVWFEQWLPRVLVWLSWTQSSSSQHFPLWNLGRVWEEWGELPNKLRMVASQSDQDPDVKRVELRTERNLSMALGHGRKDREL